MAEAAAGKAHNDLYFLHKEKLEWLREHTEPQDMQRLRKLVQAATKPLVQTFDRAANLVKPSDNIHCAACHYQSLNIASNTSSQIGYLFRRLLQLSTHHCGKVCSRTQWSSSTSCSVWAASVLSGSVRSRNSIRLRIRLRVPAWRFDIDVKL